MRARTDVAVHGPGSIKVELTLREAFALGTVLVTVEGKGPVERRTRATGEGLLKVGTLWSRTRAGEIAVAAAKADQGAESGRLAGRIALGLEKALEQADRDGADQGQWVEYDLSTGSRPAGEEGEGKGERPTSNVERPTSNGERT